VSEARLDPAELSGLAIAAIRERFAAEPDEATLRRCCAALADDRRAGARARGAGCLRRLEAQRAEGERIAKLFERRAALIARGLRYVAGVDEVGVGPLAGPVVAAAVVLAERVDLPGLNDSKKLSPAARERLDVAIRAQAIGIGIGEVGPEEIDRLNVHRAGLEAMRRAVVDLDGCVCVDHLMVDARTVPGIDRPQTPLVHGDAIDGSIAAASIVAKVHRDAIMRRLDDRHPGYGFVRHMGYGTVEHLDALRRLGPCPEHRRSFAPVAAAAR
jgi:ribonuclease HII